MTVKETKKDNKLVLELDNGDLEKLNNVISRWKFKDTQSFLRFAVSLMLKTNREVLYIDVNGQPEGRVPAPHLLIGEKNVSY
ncbi:MAG: hypothetical protein LBD17_04200 [Endomicrobium sp.]|jgi:hypothetical protein|nr:hypothetical protein [Endomicrobium sp.]